MNVTRAHGYTATRGSSILHVSAMVHMGERSRAIAPASGLSSSYVGAATRSSIPTPQDVPAFSVITKVVAPTLVRFSGPISALIVATAIRTVLAPLTHESTVFDPALEGLA